MSDKITGAGSCDGCPTFGGLPLGEWSGESKLWDNYDPKISRNVSIGSGAGATVNVNCGIHVTPRRVECKDCTYWNPERAKALSAIHPEKVPRTPTVGVCEKEPSQRITGKEVACYDGHYDASLWPKRNILMRKF